MPFTLDTFTHLFDWEKDPQRQEKIVNARLEAEFDGVDTGLSAVAARVTAVEGGAVANDSISNAELANMAESTIKGRAAGAGTGDPTDLTAAQVATILGYSINRMVFTADGTYTPTSNMKFCMVECVGGGGAGGGSLATSAAQNNAGGGGGAGGYARGLFSAATIGASKAVVIGAAGAAASGALGGNGGNTTFGSTFLVANGGTGGPVGILSTTSTISGGAAGGTASTASTTGDGFAISGQTGWDGWGFIEGGGVTLVQGGAGGNSVFGGAGTTAMVGSTAKLPGVAAVGKGSGGGGAPASQSQTAGAGGNGSAGVLIITEFILA